MRRPLWLILAVVLVFTALATTPRANGAGEIAPQVIDTDPVRGQELLVDSAITFYFDQPMDRPSVEAALKTTPTIAGTFQWKDDSTAVFKPSAPLKRATQYAFTLDVSAKSKAGVALRDSYALKLQTVSNLVVSQIVPANNTKDVEAVPTITVFFNRPVVPLGTIDDMAKLPSPITIQPAADGKGTWLSTSIYTFTPTLLQGGSTYTVTVKKGLADVTGSTLQDDFVAKFTTVTPRVIEFSPTDKERFYRDSNVTLTFSQPMDHDSTQAAFSMTPSGGKGSVTGTFVWNGQSTALTFTPDKLLDYATTYSIAVDATKARSAVKSSLGSNATINLTTEPLPAIASTTPNNNDSNAQDSGFEFTFTGSMKLTDFATRVTIDPKPGLKFDDYSDPDNTLYRVGFSEEPSTSYTVTLDTNGLVDKYGTPLTIDPNSKVYKVIGAGKLQFKFATPAYPASAELKANFIGLYNAYNPTTRVYTTHRNINSIQFGLWSLPINDFFQLARTNNYDIRNSYAPSTAPLRQWQMTVQNPTNVLRYDLLTVTDKGTNTVLPLASALCPGGLPSRLKVGDQIVVLSDDPRPINVRVAASTKAKISGERKPGVQFKVIEGPTCADNYTWWHVKSADGQTDGWIAEGDTSHYFVGPTGGSSAPKATAAATSANAANDAAAAPLKPGFYWLTFTSPDLDQKAGPLNHVMVVATANITLKVSGTQALAWVTDLKSGQPLSGITVQFSDGALNTIGTAKTDKDGLATIAVPAKALIPTQYVTQQKSLYSADIFAVVNDNTNLAVGSLNWDDGLAPYDFNQNTDFQVEDMTAYIYTDRSLYRPDQPVYYRGVLRNRSDLTYTLSTMKSVHARVEDDQGQIIYEKDVPVNDYGTFNDDFKFDANAPLGQYRIAVYPTPPGTDLTKYDGPTFEREINLAEYRVPDFQVKLTPDQTQVVQGDKINVQVDSSFFFGGALNNAKVDWDVTNNSYDFNYTGQGSYSFTDFNEDDYTAETSSNTPASIAKGTGITDAQGHFTIQLPADLGKSKQSQRFTIQATVTDDTDQAISSSVDVIVHQGEFYIGVAPENYVGTANQAQKINFVSVDLDSKPLPNKDLSVRVVERTWKSVQTVEPETGRTVWNYDVQETPVTDSVVHTDVDGKASFSFTPTHGGIYKIYATSRDSRANQITSSGFLWVAGPDYVPWRQQNSNRIDLKIDRTDYKVGDTASLLIASPFQGATKALVTVERGSILKTEVIDMPNNSTIYSLPITADMAPNAFVSVTVIKGTDDKNPVAQFRMGLISFGVNGDQYKLNIAITPDKPQAGPGDQVSYKLKVTDYAGKPVHAEVGVGLTDLAVLSLLPDTSLPIMQAFYDKQGLGVRTGNALNISVDQQTQEILNTIKGGGGGGPEGGIFQVRQKFVDTPLWKPSVMTDDNGEATVSVTLPDNLTTWRLDARAVTLPTGDLKTTLVGQDLFDLISTKPLLIRPVTPRFFVVGDKSTLVAVVNNNTDSDQDVTAKIDIKGATVTGNVTQTAKIASKSRQRFEWPIEVQDTDNVDVTFFASSADNKYTDAAKSEVGQGDNKTLPVYRYEAPETTGTGGVIDAQGGAQTEGISLPRRFTVTQGTLDLRLDRSLAATTADALKVLTNSPDQDTAATVSRFLPNLSTYGALKKLNLDNATLRDSLTSQLNAALQNLYGDQHADGGWGWFADDTSNDLVTGYVLIGLSEARLQGFTVDNDVFQNAIKYVKGKLVSPGDQAATWTLNRQAFLLYALARAGAGDFSASIRLFGIREKLSIYARAYLAMGFHLIDPKSTTNTDPLITDLQSRAILSSTGAHWEEDYQDFYNWNTDTRTTSIVLKALVDLQPDNKLLPNIVRWLISARQSDAWETSQETTWAVLALSDWMQVSGDLKPNYTFDASLNGNAIGKSETATPDNASAAVTQQIAVKDLLPDQVNKLTINRSSGAGNLYYTAHLTAYLPVDQIKAVSRGITVSRSYSLDNDKTHAPITQAHVGDSIRVTLTIIAPNDMQYLTLSDPVPAGADAVNPNLATSAIGKAPALDLADPLNQGWGSWWFDNTELRDSRTVLTATFLPKGTYEYTYVLQAGLAGTYNVLPTTAQETYFPDVYARSDAATFTLLPAAPGTTDPTNAAAAVPTAAATASK